MHRSDSKMDDIIDNTKRLPIIFMPNFEMEKRKGVMILRKDTLRFAPGRGEGRRGPGQAFGRDWSRRKYGLAADLGQDFSGECLPVGEIRFIGMSARPLRLFRPGPVFRLFDQRLDDLHIHFAPDPERAEDLCP